MRELAPGIMHGTCVDISGKGVLAVGKSGTGKSTLALELIAFSGRLVADDQVMLKVENGKVIASPYA